ncbi:MAG: hemerythrin domain-containing protein [Acidimicrobiales bacterium]
MTITAPTATEAAHTPFPIPFDLYREVHKGLRLALFDLTTRLGAADFEAADERSAAVAHVHRVIALLHHHHGHEDLFFQPILEEHDPALAAIVAEGHDETDEDIARIEEESDRLAVLTGGHAVAVGLDLYRRLALFTAGYLTHMALEEGGVMTVLRAVMSDDDLLALEMELRGSVVPPVMCEFIDVMVPGMNRAERAAMLGGMRAGAPAEIFELFRARAEAALDADSYRVLAADIGITAGIGIGTGVA